jgi:SAM-dependent methyltransferase
LAFAHDTYEEKASDDSSHGVVVHRLGRQAPSRVLDLGCGAGLVADRLRAAGHHVTGVDLDEDPAVADRVDRFVKADLDEGLPPEVGTDYDVVLAADVFEHLRQPDRLLRELRSVLRPGGVVVASIPNFAHWYPRLRVLAGRFDYDRRGILDRGHLRFFTRASFERLAESAGYEVRRVDATGLPFDVADRGGAPAAASASDAGGRRGAAALDRAAVGVWPTLFAYQFVFELTPVAD